MKLTELFAPKFVPVIVTTVPLRPLVGVKLVIVGNGTVKLVLEHPIAPNKFTHIGPVLDVYDTVATSCVEVAEVTPPITPLKVTVLSVAVGLKPLPVIVTVVPLGPLVGVKLVMIGANTVKLLLAQP